MNQRILSLICPFLLIALQSFFTSLHLAAQPVHRYNSFSYNVNEGLLQSTMQDIEFDNNNFCWLSFPNGIQKFDGKKFSAVPIQAGLPDNRMVFFFRCSNGDLLISHSEGISRYDSRADRFTLVYSNGEGFKRSVRFIGEDEQIIYFCHDKNIVGISSPDYRVVKQIMNALPGLSSGWDYQPKISDNIINHKAALLMGPTLYLWDLKSGKLHAQSDSIPHISSYFLLLKNENEVYYYSYKSNQALLTYDFSRRTSTIHPIKGKDDRSISRCVVFNWQNKPHISFNNKAYSTDPEFTALGPELVNFQGESFTGNATIWGVREDNIGNLYLITVTSGIVKVIRNNYPIRYFGMDKKENSNTLCLLPDKTSNRVLVGTVGNGLLVFDTLQQLLKHIKIFPGKSTPTYINAILKDKNGDYLLFLVNSKEIKRLSHDLSRISSIPIITDLPDEISGIAYFGTTLTQNKDHAIVQTQGRLYKTDWSNYRVSEHFITRDYVMGGLSYGNKIITHANDQLIFLDGASFTILKKIPFKNTGNVRCFARGPDNQILLGTNNGIFKIDSSGNILSHLKKASGLPDDCIYAMTFDAEGDLWCSTNKGIFRLNQQGSILQLKKEDGLQENEFNTNVVARSEDGELFFGGVNGVSSFYPNTINSFEEKINLFFTGIKANNADVIADTAAWNISRVTLPYNQSSLSFDFIAVGINNPEQYVYQYQMEGIDKQWIQNDGTQTVRYSLPPGRYTFKLYASRFFDKDGKPMKEIQIVILPPFWKTWWFLALLAVSLIGLLGLGINRRARNKYEKKLQLLESERKIKFERERISRDLHDSLGAYANAVLYNTEMLEAEQDVHKRGELMKDLKFASKDIITSLRETVWALNKENYTAEDCLLRIRNFIQPLSRYYHPVSLTVNGRAPEDKSLHYAKALNLVRLVQEAVSNSIKHAGASIISIHSEPMENNWKITVSDNGHGFNYESAKKLETGNGLSNMQRRAAEAGFDLNISSSERNGTTITIITS